MWKRLMVWLLTAALLVGCDSGKPSVDKESVPAQTDTLPSAVETYEMPDPAFETLPVEISASEVAADGDAVLTFVDQVPVYDPQLELSFLIADAQDPESSLEAHYYHLNEPAYMELTSGVFRICTDPPERNQGSHYELCVMQGTGLTKLPQTHFSQTYQVLGNEIPVDFSYSQYKDQIVLTYISPGDLPFRIQDTAIGKDQCLISFQCSLKDVTTVDYPMLLNVRTGVLTDFLGSIDKSTLPSSILNDELGDGFFLQETVLMEGNRLLAKLTGGKFFYYDPVNGSAFDLDVISGRQVCDCSVVGSDILCWNGVDDFWIIDGNTLQVMDVLTDVSYLEFASGIWLGSGCSFALYRDEDWNLHLFDFLNMEDTILTEPVGWTLEGYRCHPSPDGRKLYCLGKEENQTLQFLVLDSDRKEFMLLQRQNPNPVRESQTQWTWDNRLVVITEDYQDFYTYQWKAWEKDVTQIQERELPVLQNTDFADVQAYIPDILVDLKYAQPENFTGQTIYDFQEVYLRYGTVMKLAAVQQELKTMGLGLKIWDGFRPVSAQFKLWEIYPDDTYVANPNVGFSNHSRGFAVDLTLVDANGEELLMPTEFDDFSGRADRNYSDCSPEAARNAMLLQEVMEKHGFAGYYGEWWHFNDIVRYEVEKCFDPSLIGQWYADCQEYITLRTEANTASEEVTRIPAGEEFTCLGRTGEFLMVEYRGQRGYVLSSFAKPI